MALLALLLLAFVLPPEEQFLSSKTKPCPDGSMVEARAYDTDPDDPEALVTVFKRGELVVAVMDNKAHSLYVVGLNETMTIAEGASRYRGSVCRIPTGADS